MKKVKKFLLTLLVLGTTFVTLAACGEQDKLELISASMNSSEIVLGNELDLTTGVLKYANAGHNPPLIYNGREFTYLKSRPGFVLAGMENIKYRVNEITINPGDRILLYTDGVTEATDIK